MEDYLEEKPIEPERLIRDIRRATLDISMTRAVRLSLQEQGRAAAARRGDRLPAQPARRASGRGPPGQPGPDGEGTPTTREASDDQPFAALAFKVMADPYVGKLTYFRVYSGKLSAGGRVLNSITGRTTGRADPDDARKQPRGAAGGLCRGHRRGRRPQADFDRRHPLRPRRSGGARVHAVPGAGRTPLHRAQDEGRPGEAERRARAPRRRGPDFPGAHRRRDRPDRDLRHGQLTSR